MKAAFFRITILKEHQTLECVDCIREVLRRHCESKIGSALIDQHSISTEVIYVGCRDGLACRCDAQAKSIQSEFK